MEETTQAKIIKRTAGFKMHSLSLITTIVLAVSFYTQQTEIAGLSQSNKELQKSIMQVDSVLDAKHDIAIMHQDSLHSVMYSKLSRTGRQVNQVKNIVDVVEVK